MADAPNRIRELRVEAQWSQSRLAEAIGASKMTISDLERGNMRLDLGYMRRIAGALGCLAADLLPFEDNPDGLTLEERRLITMLRESDDQQREQVQRVADVLLPFRHDDGLPPARQRQAQTKRRSAA